MGAFFADFFRKQGFGVLISDIGTKLSNKELAEKSDIVLFSVPIHLTEKIINSVIPYVRKDQLLLDCTSLKMMPVSAMMKSPAQVIGLHPMFRPTSLGFKKQTVVMCAARASAKTHRTVKKWFVKNGARVVLMTPEKHDELMSVIQVLVHFHTIVLGNTFRKLGVPIEKTLKVASPIYRLEMDMIGRIFSQNPLLYAAIEMFNPQTEKVTRTLLEETENLAKIVLRKDLKNFEISFSKTSKFLGKFKEEALEEINKLLTSGLKSRNL